VTDALESGGGEIVERDGDRLVVGVAELRARKEESVGRTKKGNPTITKREKEISNSERFEETFGPHFSDAFESEVGERKRF